MLHRATRVPGKQPGATLLQDGANIEMMRMAAGSAFKLTKAALHLFQQPSASSYDRPS